MLKNIHLIFKTHLDVGFTNYAFQVIKQYFDVFIPSALLLARQMRQDDSSDRFIWTTGSWLIYEYLEQSDTARRREMEAAIEQGDIKWHALPFTTHTELMDVELFRLGLSLSQRLDTRFGRHTIAAKFTDVPGHTRGIIPLMAEAGVQFLHIGINPGSTVPRVPPLFRWQDESGSELIVMVQSGYGSAIVIPESEDGLSFAHSIDNRGPQIPNEVKAAYADLRAEYPGAHISASTLDAFAEKILPVRSLLPVLTREIGDTWVHGIGSDPIKVSQYRELLRLRSEWVRQDPGLLPNEQFDRFQRRLLMVPEHTWGMDEKEYLGNDEAYSAEKFSAIRQCENFLIFESSWAEKRATIEAALRELDDTPMGSTARSRLNAIHPMPPDWSSWERVEPEDAGAENDHFTCLFDPQTGSILSLVDRRGSKDWAGEANPLSWLRYQTFSAQDYERFFDQYIRPEEQMNDWSRKDFTKPGLELASPVSGFWQPEVYAVYRKGGQRLFHLRGDPVSVSKYGCPQNFYLKYAFSPLKPEMDIELQWFDKPACRMPEALWLSFVPRTRQNGTWEIDKLGREISPLEVVENGNRHLHACGNGVTYQDFNGVLMFTSLDAPLVAPGQPSLLDFNNDQPVMSGGIHFNLFNNIWGTNFPMWFEEPCRFRFRLGFYR